MKDIQGVSLPQLPNEIVKNARKTRLCAYSVAIEGWRRGLKLKWYTADSEHFKDMIIFGVNPPGRLFSLSSDTKTHYFFRTRGDMVSNEAVEQASDKGITKQILMEKNVSVPLGRGFSEDATDEEVLAYSKTIGYPQVFKPTNASLGDGVMTNLMNEKEVEDALNYVRHELEYGEVIVEQHVKGPEYRLYVVDDKVVAAYNRIPANIMGDGVSTIEQLIEAKNYERRQNARLNSCLIHIDVEILDYIEKKGYDLLSVPKKGEYIQLREKTNVSSGGDPIDVTDDISKEIKQIAVDAVKAIPNLHHAGVDVIINEGNNIAAPAVVLEINSTAQIGGILYPLRGKARNIPAAIIDYYFPETKGMSTRKSKVYFDMAVVLDPMENRSALEVEVAPAPMGKIHAMKYYVRGSVQNVYYQRWLKQQALNMGLFGHIEVLSTDEIEIVIGGKDEDKVKQYKEIIRSYKNKDKIKKIKSDEWHGQVQIGFNILDMYHSSSVRSLQRNVNRMEKEQRRLVWQIERLTKDINHILKSTSWNITKKFRGEKEIK